MTGYFDLQVNGYAGVDFNQDDLRAEQLHAACAALERDGVDGVLATIITDTPERMCGRLRRLVALRDRDPLAQQRLAGLHIEGPFLSPVEGYRGAHPADAIRPAEPGTMARLLDAAGGLARVVTLAPEQDPGAKLVRFLAANDLIVSAGHTNATRDDLQRAIDEGLTMFTHLGNGCPMQMPRHDNIIQRALHLADRLWLTFIADGVHVPFFALGNYLRLAGRDRAVVVTDAMPAAGLGPGRYRLARWEVVVGEDLAARAPDGSHLVGSAVTMARAAANLAEHLGLAAAQVDRLTRGNPRCALKQV